jgi:hypothetical protein
MTASPSDRRRIPDEPVAPASIRIAAGLAWAFVLLSLADAALSFVYFDDLVSATRASAGAEVTESTARTSAILGIVVVLGLALLWAFLGVLLRRGANWARIGLSALAAVGALLNIFALLAPESREHTGLFAVTALSVVVQVAVLFFMWRKNAGSYLTARPAA